MIARACPEYSFTNPSTLVAISGSGNVAQFTALKVIELGATVKSLSDSKGSLIAIKGFTKEDIQSIGQLKLKGGALDAWVTNQEAQRFTYHAGKFPLLYIIGPGVEFNYYMSTGKRPWTLLPEVHIALPGATQNEVSSEEAKALIKAGVRVIAEGSNMVCQLIRLDPHSTHLRYLKGCTEEAIGVFEASRKAGKGGVWYAPGSKSCSSIAPSHELIDHFPISIRGFQLRRSSRFRPRDGPELAETRLVCTTGRCQAQEHHD